MGVAGPEAGWWYWRAVSADGFMTLGHGTAVSRDGVVDQIAALLLHSPHVFMASDGHGIELVIQGPESRGTG